MDPIKERKTQKIHMAAAFGFAELFGMFALSTQGIKIGAGGFILTSFVAAICLYAALDECQRHREQKNLVYAAHKKSVHGLNSLAFLFALAGSALICLELSTSLLPNWAGPLPAALFVGTTLLLTISADIKAKGNRKSRTIATLPFILQFVGANFLMVGGLQSHNLTNFLPSSGKPLHDLNISISTFATLGAVGALAAFAMVLFNNSKRNPYQETSTSDYHEADCSESDKIVVEEDNEESMTMIAK